MSKFSIEQLTDSGGAKYYRVFRNSILITTLEQAELSDLASCVSSALAEQNSRVMGGCKCVCSCSRIEGHRPACRDPVYYNYANMCTCGHGRACHSTQSTTQEGK